MAHLTYDPYNRHRNNHREQPPEYFYNPTTTALHSYVYIEPPPPPPHLIISNPIHMPENQRHINTLFVSGLPDDVIAREIHNLFRRRPGFESCQLKFTGRRNEVVAFVTFLNHQSAVLALQALNGVPFDPQDGSVLNIELARSNSKRQRNSGRGPYVVIDNRKKTRYAAEEMSSEDGAKESNPYCHSGDPNLSDDDDDAHSTEKSNVKKADLKDPKAAEKKQTEKTSNGELQPCSTLFIANLGPKCSEDELRQALSQYPGLKALKFRARRGMSLAFADYEEVEQATTVMQALQDSTLPSSDKGGMVIEYARSKMRKP